MSDTSHPLAAAGERLRKLREPRSLRQMRDWFIERGHPCSHTTIAAWEEGRGLDRDTLKLYERLCGLSESEARAIFELAGLIYDWAPPAVGATAGEAA